MWIKEGSNVLLTQIMSSKSLLFKEKYRKSKVFAEESTMQQSLIWTFTFKGCGIGTLFVLVSPCFKENVVVTCKIGSFWCSLDNLFQKNVTVFFLDIKFQNGAHLKKGLFLTYFSHFLITREKLQKFLQHISHSHTYMYFAHPIDFFALPILKENTNLSGMVSLWYESWCWFLFAPFLEQSINNKMVSKI